MHGMWYAEYNNRKGFGAKFSVGITGLTNPIENPTQKNTKIKTDRRTKMTHNTSLVIAVST